MRRADRRAAIVERGTVRTEYESSGYHVDSATEMMLTEVKISKILFFKRCYDLYTVVD